MPSVDHSAARRLPPLLRRLLARESGPPVSSTAAQQAPDARAVYAELRRAGSNLELDWLWLASQLADPEERRDALERALAINPRSDMARRELARLAPLVVQPCRSCPA